MARHCPSVDISMPTESSATPCDQVVCPAPQDWEAFLDSGSMGSLVREEVLANTPCLEAESAIACIHGDTKRYPTARVSFHTPAGKTTLIVGFVPQIKVPVLLGWDYPLFEHLWRKTGRGSGPDRVQRPNNSNLQTLVHSEPTRRHPWWCTAQGKGRDEAKEAWQSNRDSLSDQGGRRLSQFPSEALVAGDHRGRHLEGVRE